MKNLGEEDVADFIQQTEKEEKKVDEILTQVSTRLMNCIGEQLDVGYLETEKSV